MSQTQLFLKTALLKFWSIVWVLETSLLKSHFVSLIAPFIFQQFFSRAKWFVIFSMKLLQTCLISLSFKNFLLCCVSKIANHSNTVKKLFPFSSATYRVSQKIANSSSKTVKYAIFLLHCCLTLYSVVKYNSTMFNQMLK